MLNFLRIILAIGVVFSLVNGAFAEDKIYFVKTVGVTYKAIPEFGNEDEGYQTKLLAALIDEAASKSIPYSLHANFDLSLIKVPRYGEAVVITAYCGEATPFTPTFTVAAVKEFGEVVSSINFLKRKCLDSHLEG